MKNLTRAEDIFALGVICGLIFPEYCEVAKPELKHGHTPHPYSIKKQGEDKKATKLQITQLFQSMLAPDRRLRPDIHQCISKFQNIAAGFIMENFSKTIKEKSIPTLIKTREIEVLTKEMVNLNMIFEFKGHLDLAMKFLENVARQSKYVTRMDTSNPYKFYLTSRGPTSYASSSKMEEKIQDDNDVVMVACN